MGAQVQFTMTPIGFVRGGRKEATKDHWGDNRSRIELNAGEFGPEALAGVDQLSHIEVIFYFHLHADEPTERGARHPRERADWPKVGIFAQRGRMRPNRIGLTTCRVISVKGLSIEVEGLDAVDGTPVLDIKPVWSGNAPRGDFREPEWSREIMANYW
jgi:tRNA-Thr(GGU) m(6)t(6)A37 methyltransferase TsaA